MIHSYTHTQQNLPVVLEGKTMVVEGRIASIPDIQNHNVQFQFQIDAPWKGKVMLSWYNGYNRIKSHEINNFHLLKPGQKWQLMIKLKKPRGYSNPGGFDYEAWLFEQNIKAKGYVVDYAKSSNKQAQQNILLEQPKWHYIIEQVRQKIAQMWEPFLIQWPLLGVLLALTVGLTNYISADQWQVFTHTGTIHLISISGFHISLMAGIAFSAVSFIWRRIPFLCERFPAQKAAAVGAILTGTLYSLLAGFSIPTERSLIMILVFMGGILFQRQMNVWKCFLLSLLFVILWDPFAPLTISFWLSFSAVGIILYVMMDPPIKLSRLSKIIVFLKLQGQIFLGLIPFSLFWFSQISISSLWANLLAIPITGLLVLPLALFAIIFSVIYFPFAFLCMKVSYWFFEQLFEVLQWISQKHPVILLGNLDKVWMLCLGVLGMLLLLAPKGWPARWLGLIFWLPLLMPLKTPINHGEAHLSLLDVGQGLATVVQTKTHVLVFDTGPKLSENFDTGKAVVLPYLRHQRINQIDMLVISHKDMDHRGGMMSVLKGISVKKVIVNDQKILDNAKLCQSYPAWEWDGVKFQFLMKGLEKFTNPNDTSCVLKISNGQHSLLFPGDLEAQGERALIKNYGELLRSDLIVAGHHGSKTSSSLAWVNRVNPHYVLFPTGYLNRYHFPNIAVVERYKNKKAQTLSTADCGLIRWVLPHSQQMESPTCYRIEEPHFWY